MMTPAQIDLAFHLYIIEDGLDNATLDFWRNDSRVKSITTGFTVGEMFEGLTNEEIIASAKETAVEMNKKIGVAIY